MIKFFRKIRLKLLAENKLTKYLLYAIGEIFLVVIGILIALNINNNNELKKNDHSVEVALVEIQKNLLEDIKESHYNVIDYLECDSIQDKIFDFHNNYTLDDFKQRNISPLGHHYITFINKTDGYEHLVSHLDKITDKYDPILRDLRDLYITQTSKINNSNARIEKTVYSYVDFVFNQSWYLHRLKYDEISKEEIDFYMVSDDYKKYILKFMNDRSIVYRDCQRYRVKAIETYLKIDSLLNSDSWKNHKDLLSIVEPDSFREYFGTYQNLNTKFIAKVYIENNVLFAGDTIGNKSRVWKIDNNLYMQLDDYGYPGIWRFTRNEEDAIGIELLLERDGEKYKKID